MLPLQPLLRPKPEELLPRRKLLTKPLTSRLLLTKWSLTSKSSKRRRTGTTLKESAANGAVNSYLSSLRKNRTRSPRWSNLTSKLTGLVPTRPLRVTNGPTVKLWSTRTGVRDNPMEPNVVKPLVLPSLVDPTGWTLTASTKLDSFAQREVNSVMSTLLLELTKMLLLKLTPTRSLERLRLSKIWRMLRTREKRPSKRWSIWLNSRKLLIRPSLIPSLKRKLLLLRLNKSKSLLTLPASLLRPLSRTES